MKNLNITHKNLDQKVYLIIKEMINNHRLAPGDKISQEKLASELGISRTPVISALKYLEKENLVEARPRRGFFVRAFNRQEIIRIFELREVLEGLAARRAALAVTDLQIQQLRNFFSGFMTQDTITNHHAYCCEDYRFHNFVSQIASREFLKNILTSYNIISFSFQHLSSEGTVCAPDKTLEEHLTIINAICNRDPNLAEIMMRQHLQGCIRQLKNKVDMSGASFRPTSN
ncbi:MAG: GntR family transcriptional regulator [Desulfobacteraceae bacterium]|jgi:DNA-binding GntR family transcriptional regulator